MTTRSVFPVSSSVTEERFVTLVNSGIMRAEKALGTRKAVAYTMDYSAKQIGNIINGASASHKSMWDLHAVYPGALDDVADEYGFEIVRKQRASGKVIDDAEELLTRALLMLQRARAEGGLNHARLLNAEPLLRDLHRWTGDKLAECSHHRQPTLVEAA